MPSLSGPLVLDAGSLGLLLILVTAGFGLMRGVKAEGITLAGVLGSAAVLGNEALRERLLLIVDRLPRIVRLLISADEPPPAAPLFADADQRLFFYIALFLAAVVLFYLAGSTLGGRAVSRVEALSGALLGAFGGYAIALTLINFAHDYIARHPNPAPMRLELPLTLAPQAATTNPLAPYAPLVFIAGFCFVAGLAVIAIAKARQ